MYITDFSFTTSSSIHLSAVCGTFMISYTKIKNEAVNIKITDSL